MNDAGIMMKTEKHDWTRLDAMTEEEVHAAALRDPDAQPWTAERLAKVRVSPRTITLRRALKLTQEEFATKFQIPIGTICDWEQLRAEPDETARTYLRVIAADPDGVERALQLAESRMREAAAITEPA